MVIILGRSGVCGFDPDQTARCSRRGRTTRIAGPGANYLWRGSTITPKREPRRRTRRCSFAASLYGWSRGSTTAAERTLVLRIDAGRNRPLLRQRLRGPHQAVPRHDDAVVGRDQILLGAVDDRPHAFLQRRVLHGDARDAADMSCRPAARRDPSDSRCPGWRAADSVPGMYVHVDALAVAHRRALGFGRARGSGGSRNSRPSSSRHRSESRNGRAPSGRRAARSW